MILTDDEMRFVKEVYAEKIKREQIAVLDTEMWVKVGKAPNWKEVIKIKREYAILRANA